MNQNNSAYLTHPPMLRKPQLQRRLRRATLLTGLALCLSVGTGCAALEGIFSKAPDSPADSQSGDGSGAASQKSGGKLAGRSADELKDKLRDVVKELDRKVNKTDEPIPDADLAQLKQYQTAFASAGAKDSVFYVKHLLKFYQIENGWRGERSKSAATIAKLIDSKVVEEGTLAPKEKLSLKAQKDSCYFLFSYREKGKRAGLDFHGQKGDTALQRFYVGSRNMPGSGMVKAVNKRASVGGFCATKELVVDVSSKLESGDGLLRYFIAEAPRAKFPAYIASIAQISAPDRCDAANWETLWTSPVPGTIVYMKDAEPILIFQYIEVGDPWITGYSVEVAEGRYSDDSMVSSVEAVKFPKSPRFKKCSRSNNPHHSAGTKKVVACYERLDKRYLPQFTAAHKAEKRARTYSSRLAARGRINQLADAKKRAAKSCERLEAGLHKELGEAYKRIVEHYKRDKTLLFDRSSAFRDLTDGS